MQHKKDTEEPVVVKKYANRRLYNTDSSTYVTLDDLAEMVKSGRDFVVYDAKSGGDITRSVLTQIIFAQEGRQARTRQGRGTVRGRLRAAQAPARRHADKTGNLVAQIG